MASSSLERLFAASAPSESDTLSSSCSDASTMAVGADSVSSFSVVLTGPSVRRVKMPLSYASKLLMLLHKGYFQWLQDFSSL